MHSRLLISTFFFLPPSVHADTAAPTRRKTVHSGIPLLTRDRASSFRLKRGLFVYHDEIYSDFFLFRAQKRGILKKVRFLPQEAIPKAKGLWSFALGIVLSPRLCGDNLPIFKSKRLHQIGVTPANAGKNCKTLCVSSIPFSRVTHIFK